MAAETTETPGNPFLDGLNYPEDLHTEVHECLRLLRQINAELEPLRPLLKQFTSPVAAASTLRRMRRNGG